MLILRRGISHVAMSNINRMYTYVVMLNLRYMYLKCPQGGSRNFQKCVCLGGGGGGAIVK